MPSSACDRRAFLKTVAMAGVVAAGASLGLTTPAAAAEAIALPELPYPPNALEPVISANTISFHHGKHHAGYVKKGMELLAGSGLEGQNLEDIVKGAWSQKKTGLFNNAAQVWNHNFYWQSLKPGGGGEPPAKLKDMLAKDFSSLDAAKKALHDCAMNRFASGWAWLVADKGVLKVVDTMNAETPLTMGLVPLLVIDVWEHAYYLDHQNKRADYVAGVIDKLLNWDFALKNLEMAA